MYKVIAKPLYGTILYQLVGWCNSHNLISLRPEQGYSKNTVLKLLERPKPSERNAGSWSTLPEQAPIVTRDERIKPPNFRELKGICKHLWVIVSKIKD